ncbi:MAG TPA: YbjN domain-containing protein, partial [Ilumatobacteraceae bacterium]|nr:YbjN domain-containing protein [Ilumatobacteraceae bacterium]
MSELHPDDSVGAMAAAIDAWLTGFADTNPAIAAVDRDPATARWYVRMRGDEKEFITVWLTLGQRTLQYEAYVMPAPEENVAAVYENLLRRNQQLIGHHFAIGVEDAVFLRGDLPLGVLCEDELDRVIGSLYATTELCFRSLLRL